MAPVVHLDKSRPGLLGAVALHPAFHTVTYRPREKIVSDSPVRNRGLRRAKSKRLGASVWLTPWETGQRFKQSKGKVVL